MGKKKFARTPLLYIHQPNVTTPEAQMQSDYTTPKRTANNGPEITNQDTKDQAKPINKKKNTGSKLAEKATNHIETNDSDEDAEDDAQDEKRPKFKDMETIQEKVDYFVNMPDSLRIKCEVKTEGRSYRGIIVDCQEDAVLMRVGRRSISTKIPVNEIQNIRLIGF